LFAINRINLPIVGVGLVGIGLFLKLDQVKQPVAKRLKEFDWLGFVLFMASLTAFLIPVTWGGIQHPWDSWQTLVPLCLGVAGFILFLLYEKYISKVPFFPIKIFSNYSVCILFFGSFVQGLFLFTFAYYLPEYYQTVQGYSPLMSGVAALPMTLTTVPTAGGAGLLVDRTGRYRWILWIGWALTSFGCGLLILLDVGTTVPAWIFLTAVAGLGLGLLLPVNQLALQASVPPAGIAISATLAYFFRSFGQTVGVAIGSTILENRMKLELHKGYLAGTVPASQGNVSAVALVEILRDLPAGELKSFLDSALARSLRVIWATMCGLSGLNMVMNLVLKEYDMNQEHITDQRFLSEQQIL
jgi:MFS family permease